MLKAIVTSFQRLGWSVNRKIGICLAVPVFIIIISSVTVFFALQSLQSSLAIERLESKESEDVQIFNQRLRTLLNVYNDAIYLSQVKTVINNFYQNETDNGLAQIKQDKQADLANPNSTISQITSDYTKLGEVFNQANTHLQNSEFDQAVIAWASSLDLRRDIAAKTAELQKQIEQEQQTAVQNSKSSVYLTLGAAALAGLLTVLSALLSGWLLTATIGRPLAATRRFLDLMVTRDLSGQLDLANRDELGDLAQALNLSVKTLRGIVESFNIGAEVESAARNLHEISLEQNWQVSDQVNLLSQITRAIEELNNTASTITSNAGNVAEVADSTLDGAQQVNTVTNQVGQLMQQLQHTIEEADQAIARADKDFTRLQEQLQDAEVQNKNSQTVVNIIANIAKEIHLLSLNAAIEAAGAGQFGERFKVVAAQIKNLSNRSATSAEEITQLLTTAHSSIQNTAEQSAQSQASIERVVSLSEQIRALARETLACTERNHQAVEQILQAATNSTNQANQIKIATTRQQLASQEILQTITALNSSVMTSAGRTNEVAETSTQLNSMSQTLALKLAELKLPLAS